MVGVITTQGTVSKGPSTGEVDSMDGSVAVGSNAEHKLKLVHIYIYRVLLVCLFVNTFVLWF